MEALFNFLLQEDAPGESFDARAARPSCKVCGADAWLQWDGQYADYCSRSCRDKRAGSQGHLPGTRPFQPPQRRAGGSRGHPDMLGERQVQLQQEKEAQWELQFSPRNRYLPRKKATNQERDPRQRQQRGKDPGAVSAAAGAFAEAAAAKKVAKALRQRAPRKASPRNSISPRMEGGPTSVATTPRRMPSIGPSCSEESPPLQRQRTVARFVEQGEDAAELQAALKEYQENLSGERHKLEEEGTAAAGHLRRCAGATTAADAGHLRRCASATSAAEAAADAEPASDQKRKETESSVRWGQRERAKYEEQVKAIKTESEQQLQQHKAQLAAEVKRLADEELDVQRALEKELGEVRASLQQLKQQQEQHQQQHQKLLQEELQDHLRAHLQQDLEQQLEQKLRKQLQEELEQQVRQQLHRKPRQLTDPESGEGTEGRRSKEHILRKELVEQQLRQEKRLEQQLLQQQRQQEKLLHQLQQQAQTLQHLAAATGTRSDVRRPQRPCSRGEEEVDQQLRDLLLQGLFSHFSVHESQQQQPHQHQKQQQPLTLEVSSWAERELALQDAKAAAAAAASKEKGSPFRGPYEGQLEAAVLETNLQLLEPTQQQQPQQGLRFGSKLQIVFRVATGPGAWEEKETSFSADGRWGETFSFRVHWPSAAAAAASAALYAQLWATINSNAASTGHCNFSNRCFLGEAVLPLPTFTSPWEYRAPLRWRSSLGVKSQQQQLLQHGNLLLRVQFHPTDEAHAPVASTMKQEERQALFPSRKAGRLSKPSRCKGSNKASSSSSRTSQSTDSSGSRRTSGGVDGQSEKQLQLANLPLDVSEEDGMLQQRLLQQLEELSLDWRRELSEEQRQQKHHRGRIPVLIDGQLLQEHLQRAPMTGALCTNSLCSNLAGAFPDLYGEEEFRVWGLCNSCQQQLFTTPLPAGRHEECACSALVQLASPFAHCYRDTCHQLGVAQALAKAAVRQEPLPFAELRLDGDIPVAFPTPDRLWPSALQLLHAQRFSLVCIQERLRVCRCSGELLALLQSPLLQRFERPDWHSRAAAAVRTCLLLLLQQHPKLQLLLSSLRGRRISYPDPLQLRLLRRIQQECPQSEGEPPCILHQTDTESSAKPPSLPHNFAGSLLMDLCAALGPPIYE